MAYTPLTRVSISLDLSLRKTAGRRSFVHDLTVNDVTHRCPDEYN
jgi:hypothetical protein